MTGLTDIFGGSTVQPSNVAYASVALSATIPTYWPAYVTGTQQPLARLMDVIASTGGLAIKLPDATLAGLGQDVFFNNPGSNTYSVQDSGGNIIATIAAGQQKYLYLSDNSTTAGTWRVTLFGVGASSPDASALAGSGLKAIGSTLNQSTPSATISTNATFTSADRAKMYVNIGGAITCTLPLSSAVSNDFFMEIRNQGTGTLTLACTGGELIDGSASIVLQVNESCFFQAGVANWYTVGRGRNTQFNFTQLLKTVTGGTTTLSLTEASNVVQTYSGTAVSANTLVLPSVVQVYYISNQVLGGFSFTIQSPTPGATLVLPYGQNAVVFCDGVNVINASTAVAGISSLLLLAGSVSVPSLAIAAINNGLYAPTSTTVAVSAGGVNAGTFSSNGYNGRIGGDTQFAGAFTTLSATTTVVAQSGLYVDSGTNAGIYSNGAGGLNFRTNTTLQATLDTSGNLGLGVTPSATYTTNNYKVLEINGSSFASDNGANGNTSISTNAYRAVGGGWNYKSWASTPATLYQSNSGQHLWYVAPSGTTGNPITFTQAMTLDASGHLSVSKSAATGATIVGTSTATGDKTYPALYLAKFDNDTTVAQVFAQFAINNGGAGSGQINANGAGAAAFGAYSDITLKENVTPLGPQLASIMAIETIEFDYIESEGGGHQIGFSAQNMQGIYPDVVGERADGKLTLTGWDKTTARLVKAIQELKAEFDAYKELHP